MPRISHLRINCGWPHRVLPPTKIWIVFRLVSQSAITANRGCPTFLRLSTQYCLMLLIRAYVLLICRFPSAAARTTFVFGPSSEWGPGTSGTSPRMRTLEFVSRALATAGRRLIRTLGRKLPSRLEIGSGNACDGKKAGCALSSRRRDMRECRRFPGFMGCPIDLVATLSQQMVGAGDRGTRSIIAVALLLAVGRAETLTAEYPCNDNHRNA